MARSRLVMMGLLYDLVFRRLQNASNLGLSVCWVSAFRGVKGAKPPSPITKAGGVGGGLERPDARR